jgi:hypothetical protein
MTRVSLLFLVFCLVVGYSSLAQDVVNMNGVQCGLHGSALPGRVEYDLNVLKNRSYLPLKSRFVKHITLEQLLHSSAAGDFSQDSAIMLSGYVFNVRMGAVESCNCKTKDDNFRDTHIELTPDENHTEPEYRMVVEVTPRLRAAMQRKGIDWTTKTLRANLIGHKVQVSGWLLFDPKHSGQAVASNPTAEEPKRGTCWEIHPVTDLKILD